MAAVRDLWTDDRLDDLNHRVDRGFEETNAEFRALRLEMRTEFAAVRSEMGIEFAAVRSEMGGMRAELSGQIAQLHSTMVRLFGGMIVTFVVGFLAILIQL